MKSSRRGMTKQKPRAEPPHNDHVAMDDDDKSQYIC